MCVDLQEHVTDAQGRALVMGDDDLDLLHVGHSRGMTTEVTGFVTCDCAAADVGIWRYVLVTALVAVGVGEYWPKPFARSSPRFLPSTRWVSEYLRLLGSGSGTCWTSQSRRRTSVAHRGAVDEPGPPHAAADGRRRRAPSQAPAARETSTRISRNANGLSVLTVVPGVSINSPAPAAAAGGNARSHHRRAQAPTPAGTTASSNNDMRSYHKRCSGPAGGAGLRARSGCLWARRDVNPTSDDTDGIIVTKIVRARFLELVGMMLQTIEVPTPDQLDRVQRLWEWRLGRLVAKWRRPS